MADIIDTEEIDRDTVQPEKLNKIFSNNYHLLTQTAVSLKKTYINKLSVTQSLKVAVGLLDNSIEVYELSKASLSRVCRLSGHEKSLTEVVFSPKEDNLLYSCGQDGVVKLWDIRDSGRCVQEYKDGDTELIKQYECMDVSCNGRVLCAGTRLVQDDAYLVFWDQRNTAALGGYWNSHTDDISQVKFHKQKTELVATGSLDSLMNIFNIMEQTEEDALLYSLNVANSVERLAWVDDRRVGCITQSNDFQLWDTESGDMIKEFTRDNIAKSIKRSKGDDCYLVDAYSSAQTETEDASVLLLAGSYGGDGDVLRSVAVSESDAGYKLHPSTLFAQNKQIVRCCRYHPQRDLLVTTGESGLIDVWAGAGGPAAENDVGVSVVSNQITKSLKKLHVKRHKPY